MTELTEKTIVVIGAGMVGTSVAWHLQQRGARTILVDSQLPGEETSFGNAGLIQREAVFPHTFPTNLRQIMRVLPNTATDIRYRGSAMVRYCRQLWSYWRNSFRGSYEQIVPEWASLIEHCTAEHEFMFTRSNAADLVRKVGWIQISHSQQSFIEAKASAEQAAKFGVEYRVLLPQELAQLEPDLNTDDISGAIHWLNSWQVVNPGALVKAYAKSFKASGGVFEKLQVKDLTETDNGWQVVTATKVIEADMVVVAAGPWSAQLLRLLGYHFPLFPMRGYHRHFSLRTGAQLNHSLYDKDYGYALGPMQMGIRLTTGAELTKLDGALRLGQLEEDEKVIRRLLPIADAIDKHPWFGHRPCMPDMKPVIGNAPRHRNLWLAFGHAHQGFTLGPATGRLLAELMSGQPPYINPAPFAAQRFKL